MDAEQRLACEVLCWLIFLIILAQMPMIQLWHGVTHCLLRSWGLYVMAAKCTLDGAQRVLPTACISCTACDALCLCSSMQLALTFSSFDHRG